MFTITQGRTVSAFHPPLSRPSNVTGDSTSIQPEQDGNVRVFQWIPDFGSKEAYDDFQRAWELIHELRSIISKHTKGFDSWKPWHWFPVSTANSLEQLFLQTKCAKFLKGTQRKV